MAYNNPVVDHRRKWDTIEFARKANERREAEKAEAVEKDAPPAKREKREYDEFGKVKPKWAPLQPREFKVDLESKVGKSVVINKATPSSETGGYYCDMCDCVVKDSICFLDHINGRKHQKNLGMSMKVKKSTLEDVKARFELKKAEQEKEKKNYDFEERMKDLQEEESRMSEYRRDKRQRAKQRKRGDDDDEPTGSQEQDSEFAQMMGFGGFGSKK